MVSMRRRMLHQQAQFEGREREREREREKNRVCRMRNLKRKHNFEWRTIATWRGDSCIRTSRYRRLKVHVQGRKTYKNQNIFYIITNTAGFKKKEHRKPLNSCNLVHCHYAAFTPGFTPSCVECNRCSALLRAEMLHRLKPGVVK